jgi:adenylate kinase
MKKQLGFDIVLLGAPASGKDTQADILSKKFALKSVESGKYLRGLMRNKTKIGKDVNDKLSKGLPAPSKVVEEFLDASLRLAPKDKSLIFVGNPRLKNEAVYLVEKMSEYNRDFIVIYINLPLKAIWERSEKRLRNLDDTKYIQTRIDWHKKEVSKTVRYFQKLDKLKFIDGDRTRAEVNKEIIKVINDYKQSTRDKKAKEKR